MNRSRIGVVGAYGATGAVVARTLAAQNAAPLLLIGRNPEKLDELAKEVGGDVRVAAVDLTDDAALTAATKECRTLINCAGPASVILDRVGQAALACGCHYIDPGPDARVFAALKERNDEVVAKGLTFLLGAGYVPGLSEVLLRAIYEVHRGKTSAPCRVRLFIVDRNDWSLNGFVDIIERVCRNPPEIGVYRDGIFHRRSMLRAWLRRKLPGQPHAEVLMPIRWPEIDQFVADVKPLGAAVYVPMEPSFYFVVGLFARVEPHRLDLAARIAQALFRMKSKRLGRGGILYAEASGRRSRQPRRWLIEVPEGRGYARTGEVAALAAALVGDGTIARPGVRYLAHAVDPHDFIVRLLLWGVETIDLASDSPNAADFGVAGATH
jgi:hypothetical protein